LTAIDVKKWINHYEDASFKDQYIPNVSAITNVAYIRLVSAGAPVLIKMVKTSVKKISYYSYF
tara:strand:+ start:449 stop:637 length:189 start_codon:yes stop_codon:yes gene_type:complete